MMMARCLSRGGGTILLALSLCSTPCSAQPSPAERAEQYHQRGMALADAGEHAAAAAAFERAYRLDPQVKYLFNQALAHSKAQQCPRAVALFDRVLTQSLPAEVRHTAERERAACLIEMTPPSPRTVAPAVAPSPVPTTPAALGPRARHVPSLAEPLAGGRDEHATVAWYTDAVGWALAGTGVVALGIGTGLMVDQRGLRDGAADVQQQHTSDYDTHHQLVSRADSERLAGAILLAGGAALAVGATVRFALLPSPEMTAQTDPRAVTLTLTAAPQNPAVQLGVTF